MNDQRPNKLAPKQARFVEEYLIDLNATQAAIRAGYSPKMAGRIGFQLLEKTGVQAAIQAAQQARSERTQITADWVLRELALIAGADLAEFVEWGADGVRLKDSAALDATKRRVIVEVSESKSGVKIKLADKKGALDSLARHLGLFKEQIDATTRVIVEHVNEGLSD